MTSFMEMKLKSFRKVKNQIMAAVGTLEILILLGYGADAPKKDFTPISKFNFSEKATRIWSYLLLDLMFTN